MTGRDASAIRSGLVSRTTISGQAVVSQRLLATSAG
jgi:hypothetical protein